VRYFRGDRPSEVKAPPEFGLLAARINPCPFKPVKHRRERLIGGGFVWPAQVAKRLHGEIVRQVELIIGKVNEIVLAGWLVIDSAHK
jgi:hypothetical protein